MKKFLLLMIVMFQFCALNVLADSREIVYKYEDGGQNMENQVPYTYVDNSNKELGFNWGSVSNPGSLTVYNKTTNKVVYNSWYSPKSRQAAGTVIVPLEGCEAGEYIIIVSDGENDIAEGSFELK